jgi:hypothetical protein
MSDDTLDQVRHLVEEVTCVRNVRPEARLHHDLGIGGDDAWELLELIRTKFGTSFAGLSFTDFFIEEDGVLVAHLAKFFGIRVKKRPLTIQHLGQVAKRGSWFDPPGDPTR